MASGADAGGLVGKSYGSSNYLTIDNSYATGTVASPYDNGVGGLVGSVDGYVTISKSHSSADVNGSYNVGGLAGYAYYPTIDDSYATGSVAGSNGDVGGLVGYSYGASTIDNSYATGDVVSSQGADVGGLAGYLSTATIYDSYLYVVCQSVLESLPPVFCFHLVAPVPSV